MGILSHHYVSRLEAKLRPEYRGSGGKERVDLLLESGMIYDEQNMEIGYHNTTTWYDRPRAGQDLPAGDTNIIGYDTVDSDCGSLGQ
jgi:hypothetical protein